MFTYIDTYTPSEYITLYQPVHQLQYVSPTISESQATPVVPAVPKVTCQGVDPRVLGDVSMGGSFVVFFSQAQAGKNQPSIINSMSTKINSSNCHNWKIVFRFSLPNPTGKSRQDMTVASLLMG